MNDKAKFMIGGTIVLLLAVAIRGGLIYEANHEEGPVKQVVEAPAMTDMSARSGRAMDVLRVASGNFIEMYDFMVFGYFAAAIGSAYFPGSSELGTLLKALATFGVGFVAMALGLRLLWGELSVQTALAVLLLTISLAVLLLIGVFERLARRHEA